MYYSCDYALSMLTIKVMHGDSRLKRVHALLSIVVLTHAAHATVLIDSIINASDYNP